MGLTRFKPPFLLEAHHVHTKVRTAADYRREQRLFLARNRAALPALAEQGMWPPPWVHEGPPPTVVVSGGMVQVGCECGNYPAVMASARLACCYECGAVYEDVAFPAEWPDVVAVLVLRPDVRTRNWLPGETLADLRAENLAHGVGV